MPGARSVLKKTTEVMTERPVVFRDVRAPRAGIPTQAEKDIIRQFVADQPGEITKQQLQALVKLTRRSKETIVRILQEARDEFAESALDYVRMHKLGVQTAIANGDARSLDAGLRASQWAIEHQNRDGERVIDAPKAESKSSAAQIMIGIKLGGRNEINEQATVDGLVVTEE